MKLSQLLKVINTSQTQGIILEQDIDFITLDSRTITPSSIFIAIQGLHVDGHDYLNAVYEKGCRIAIVEKFTNSPITQIKVDNSRLTYSHLAYEYFQRPGEGLSIVGITATNGKTTIAYMLYEMLKALQLNVGLLGTVKIESPKRSIEAHMTTPESFELYQHIAQLKADGIKVLIMEVSSSSLEQFRAADLPFKVVSFNNFSREHIDQHGSFEKYWEAKSSLITQAKANTTTIINLDNDFIVKTKGQGDGPQITYSFLGQQADISLTDLDLSQDYPKFKIHVNRTLDLNGQVILPTQFEISLKVLGVHMVKNALSAISMALALGITPTDIANGIQHFKGIERRFECIFDHEYCIFDDHFANADNIEVTLDSLANLKYQNLHMVYAIRGNRGITVNTENLQTLKNWLPKLNLKTLIGTETKGLVTAKDLVSEAEKEVYFNQTQAFNDPNLTQYYYPTMEKALEKALEVVQPQDVLILCGCQGMDMGARILLNKIKDQQPQYQAEIDALLDQRVCG